MKSILDKRSESGKLGQSKDEAYGVVLTVDT